MKFWKKYFIFFELLPFFDILDIANAIFRKHGVQRRMISVDNFFVFLRLLLFAVLLLYVI